MEWVGYGENNSIEYKLNNGKGHVKEYKYDNNTSYLIYEGEYLNGERNGKGIEYDDYGYIKYECEYLNGKKNGKGKMFGDNEDHDLVFEGIFKNDEPWNGKLPDKNGDIKEIKNGKLYKYENGELKLEYIFLKEDGYYKDYDESDD